MLEYNVHKHFILQEKIICHLIKSKERKTYELWIASSIKIQFIIRILDRICDDSKNIFFRYAVNKSYSLHIYKIKLIEYSRLMSVANDAL